MNKLKLTVILAIISDLLNTLYIEFYFIPEKTNIDHIAPIMAKQMGSQVKLDPLFLKEFSELFKNTISIVFLCFLIINLFCYFFILKNKKWAINYIKSFAFLGIILVVFELFNDRNVPFIWLIVNIISGILYSGVFYLLRKQVQQNEDSQHLAQK